MKDLGSAGKRQPPAPYRSRLDNIKLCGEARDLQYTESHGSGIVEGTKSSRQVSKNSKK